MDATEFCIGDAPQLFVDSWLIESCHAVTRRWYKPVRQGTGPVLTADRPWEHFPYFTYSNHCVLRDQEDGRYKCWYEDLGPLTGGHPSHNRLLYAESGDGITWEKPLFDIVLHEGSPTNIVAGHDLGHGSSTANPWPTEGVHSAAVIIDPDPPRREERFRMWYTRCPMNEELPHHVVGCAHSPDGIHWQPYPEAPTMGSSSHHVGDVSCLWYDPDGRMFVMNTRHGDQSRSALPPATARIRAGWAAPYAPHRPDLLNKRRVCQTRSHDFLHWSEPVFISSPGEIWDNLDDFHYGMAQFQVGRQHFGTLGVFRHADNEMEVRLLHSRDGYNWHPADRAAPFISPRGQGCWDAHMVSLVSPPVQTESELRFFHGGCSGHHDYWMSGAEELDHAEALDPAGRVRFGMGVATLRRDGFCSISTGEVRPGAFAARPVLSAGDCLHINARCQPGGSVRVELTDPAGAPIKGCSRDVCDPFLGDCVDHTVTWNSQPTAKGSGFRRIVFYLEKAEVFSFRFSGDK